MADAVMRMDVLPVRSSRSSGWLISVVLHGGVVALAMQAVMEVKPHLQSETFQWKVALQEAPAPTPVASADPPRQEPVPEPARRPSVSPPVQQPSKAAIPRPVERTAVVQTIQPMQSTPQVIERSAIQERQTVVTERQPVAAQPVQETAVTHAQEVVQQDIHQTVQSSDISTMTPESSAPVTHEAAAVVEAQAMAVEQAVAVAQPVVEAQAHTIAARSTDSEPHDPVESEPVVVHHASVEHRVVRERESAQADLGWLSESLWERIEQLKRYPRQARVRRWEGKVVLEAVIRHDGTILECLVAESSGHGLLDQDAISVLRKASPLALKHPLGKEQITILVPIAYRLES